MQHLTLQEVIDRINRNYPSAKESRRERNAAGIAFRSSPIVLSFTFRA